MPHSMRSLAKEVESPSAMGPGFSNTPQPKPDRGSAPVAGHGIHLNRLTASGMGGRLDETPNPLGPTDLQLFPSTTFDNSSEWQCNLGVISMTQ